MTMSPLDWAWDGAGAARLIARTSAVTMARICRMDLLLSSRTSVRERPDTEVVADVPPQAVQSLGLDDEEEDDEGPEHHEAEVGDEVEHGLGREEDAAEGLHGVADADGEEGDEDGPEHGAEHGAEPADDDHGEVVDGDADLELLVVGDAEVVGVEDPRHPRVEGRDGEGEELVAEDVDADDLRGDVLVADGDEGAPYPAPDEVQRAHDGQDHEDEDVGAKPRTGNVDGSLHATADEGDVVDGPLDDELTGEGGDREVEALDAHGGDPHHRPHQRGHEPTREEIDGPRRAQADGQVCCGVGAHRHEGPVPDGHLPRVADEDVEAEGADHGDPDEVGEGEVVLIEGERNHPEEEDGEGAHCPPRDGQRIQRHVRLVRRLEHPRLTMKHGYPSSWQSSSECLER